MNLYSDFLKTSKTHEYILTALLALYIVLDIGTPIAFVSIANNPIFQIILGLLVISLFFYVNPIIGILAMIAFFTLRERSKVLQQNLIPNENVKYQTLQSFNQVPMPVTLEENMVSKMAPYVSNNNLDTKFQSLLQDTHNASYLADLTN